LFERQTLTPREAHSDDFDSVSLFLRHAYQRYENSLPPEAWKFYVEDMIDLRRRLNESQLIVAELDGQLVGTVTLYLDAETAEHRQSLSAIVKEVADVTQRLDRLYDALETGKIKLEDLAPRIQQLRIRQEQLEAT
jgi:hypothetical protein